MGAAISSTLTQMFPPKPSFTEKDLPDLHGKVYIVTGSNTGVGKELAQLLYSKNAKIYIAARSEDKAKNAIEEIKKAEPKSTGELIFLALDLSDLTKVKISAERFLALETKLHVLFNNAGIMTPNHGQAKTPQGHELHLGTNNIGTFMFTKLLTPLLITTAKSEPQNTVRVIWVSSSATEITGLRSVGLAMDNLDYHIEKPPLEKYSISKTGNYLQGVEYAKRYKPDGIISIPLNPGNLWSELYREQVGMFRRMAKSLAYPSINGAYTELFAGLSPEITIEKTGSWVVPWGRILPIRKDLVSATKTEAEGGNGTAQKFWEWNEDQVKPFL